MQTGDPLQELAAFVDERLMRAGPSPWQQQPYFTEPEPEEQAIPLSHYLWVLRRHRWKIIAFVGISVVATLIVSKRLTPIYESTVIVDVDRRTPTGIIGQEAVQSALNDADQFLATQVKLIQSDSVLRPVADKYHLRNAAQSEDEVVDQARKAEAPVVLKDLKVVRPPNTYLLLIGYRSRDPRLAANVANAIASSYVEHSYNIRFRSTASLATFMEKQLEELKAKMERSDSALAQFERELNVINPEDKTNMLSVRLLQLNNDFTNAQTDRLKKEAAFRSVSSGTLESAQASTQGEALKRLGERLDEAQAAFAQAKVHYGTNHPEFRKADTQFRQVQEQFDAAARNVARRVEVEYREAANRETMLGRAVAQAKTEFDRINARSFEYQTLKHEADADKKLYEELITKIREATINAGFQSSTVRLADSARPGLKPVFPNIPLNVALALLLSSLVAIGAVILIDTLDTAVRDSEQVSRIAKAEVIAGLPMVKGWKNRLALACPVDNSNQRAPVRTDRSEEDRMRRSFEEAIGTLRNTILLGSFDRRIKSLMVTSATPGEGKSTVAAFLALAHALQGHKTLLIDCDLRRPSIDQKLGLSAGTSLSDVVLNGLPWRDAVTELPTPEHLRVLLNGTASRRCADLIGKVLPEILEEAVAEYDLVLVDAPPALGFPEPLEMATAVDGVVVIALAGQTDRKALASVVTTLKRLRSNVVGVVMNEITRDVGDGYYYHGYYGKYAKYYGSKSEAMNA
jgi:capsular exopolysaccharide synthesis family protein